MTPEAQENRMIARAMDLAEQQLIDGTASSQVITHFLKLGSLKARLELQKLEQETALAKAKTASLESAQHSEELYEKAIRAMQTYAGYGDPDED
jgi:hypothetical protein